MKSIVGVDKWPIQFYLKVRIYVLEHLFLTPWGSGLKETYSDWSMALNSQFNPSTVGLHRTNYLTYISIVSPNAKKKKK